MNNLRTLRDANLSKSKALPAAAASNQSSAIDFTETNPGRLEDVEILIELPATPNLVDAKTITLTVEDSADGTTFATVADIPAIVVTGAGGAGGTAVARRFAPPITLRRYIRLAQAVLTAGGDSTAVSGVVSLVF